MLSIAAEERQYLLHAKLASTSLTTALDSLICEFSFLLLQVQDPLFDRVFDSDLINDDIDFLGQAMDSVDGLLLDEL